MNNLTPAQLERLAILSEECGEVQQMIGKIIRHGYDSHNPFDSKKTPNRSLLEKELGDVEFAVKQMIDSSDINRATIGGHSMIKAESIKPYLHHQGS